jgi:putative oxidoreductase
MAVPESILRLLAKARGVAKAIEPVGPLLARIVLGYVFARSGWGKLHDLDKVAGFFADLHVPMPAFNAVLVACTELIGGSLILLGLFARLAALPLMVTMIVAIATAKREEVESLGDLFGLSEFLYLVLFAWIAAAGAGRLSADHVLAKRVLRDEGGSR